MRTFIAIDFSAEIISKVAEIIKFFKSQTPDRALKWVAPQNLHLTVKFLGEVPEKKIGQIKELILQTTNNQDTFEIEVDGLGMYPNRHTPRVIWLGINNDGQLKIIHNMLDKALEKADILPDKRDFDPHLTIARVRRHTDNETIKKIGEILSGFKVDSLGSCIISSIVLYKSELTPEGPIYTTLLSSPLNKV